MCDISKSQVKSFAVDIFRIRPTEIILNFQIERFGKTVQTPILGEHANKCLHFLLFQMYNLEISYHGRFS